MTAALASHLATGATHVCQCWVLARRDGRTFGFTDHDLPLTFGGVTFLANSGMSAKALSASTGLSVDNTEAVGLLQSDVISETDIAAGRFDGAEIAHWQVQWDNVAARKILFKGAIGDITRQAGQFVVELRGLSDLLNQVTGRTYLRRCSAVLGDDACGVNTDTPAFTVDLTVDQVTEQRILRLASSDHADRWFADGQCRVVTGAAQGLEATIKQDRITGNGRTVVLTQALRGDLRAGDRVRLVAGCDRRAETCRIKFANLLNFRGFPDLPGDDWLMAVPQDDSAGGSESRLR